MKAAVRKVGKIKFTHCSPEERLRRVKAVDMDGDTLQKDIFNNISYISQKLDSMRNDDSDNTRIIKRLDKVKVYDGFQEHASRLVFHYGDKFQHLPKGPMQLTILVEGRIENELQELPIKPGDDPKDVNNEKLVARSLTSFPFPQTMDTQLAQLRLKSQKYAPHMANFVYRRDNESYGICHTWPVKYNDEWRKTFKCSTENPNTNMFHPQAAAEFGESMCRLFGADALERSPLIYAERDMHNEHRLYVGTPDDLEQFLRSNPNVCDQLQIAKLFPGGFVGIIRDKKGKTGLKHFEFQPVVEQALYMKKGWETMPSIKPMSLFDADCTLGNDITATWMSSVDELVA